MVREGLTEKMVFEQREQAMQISGRTFAERRKNRYEDLEARVCHMSEEREGVVD